MSSGRGERGGGGGGRGGGRGAIPKRLPKEKPKTTSNPAAGDTGRTEASIDGQPLVIFDLETTGLARTDRITQLAAVATMTSGTRKSFDVFILPGKVIPPHIVKLTGISGDVGRREMFFQGKEVPCSPLKVALQNFSEWLRACFGRQSVYLGAHNCQRFDSRFLIRALDCCGEEIREAFEKQVAGFVDTLPLFKKVYPGLESYKQTALVQQFLGEQYNAHNAIDDVTALLKLYEFSRVEPSVLKSHSFTVESVRRKEADAVAKAEKEKEDDLAERMRAVRLEK